MEKQKKQPPDSGKQSGSALDPPEHYPPGKLPALTREMLQALLQRYNNNQLPTEKELDIALKERIRANKKVDWALTGTRPDANERALSANATMRITLGLDTLTAQGLDYRELQKKKASGPRTPLYDAMLSELRNNPEATARQIWNALSNYKEGDLRITTFQYDRMQWDYCGKQDELKFITFKSKLSRMRRKHVKL